MFDIGAAELLVIVIVAVVVIGPKDMPRALRTAGRRIGKVRRMSAHFRTGIDTMIREAELEEMEQKWKARNEEIMARTGSDEPQLADEMTEAPSVSAEAATAKPVKPVSKGNESGDQQLPLEPPKKAAEE